MVVVTAFHVAGCCCMRLLLTDQIKSPCACADMEIVGVYRCGHLRSYEDGEMQGLRLKNGIYHPLSDPGKYRRKESSV